MIDHSLQYEKLALNGGTPVRDRAWVDNVTTSDEELEALKRVMGSGYLSLFEGSHTPDAPFSFYGGPEVQLLEQEFAAYYRSPFAVSMNSATSGLYAAIGALDIGFGDEVIVSPFTMTACAAAPLVYGAIPVFADIDAQTGCLDPASIEQRLSPRTRAILVVHQFGFPAQMDAILALAKKHNLYVIEDCAQAHGAKYGDQLVGTLGDVGVFSFNVNKTIQSGEGAVVLCRDEHVHRRLALIRNHGEAVVGPARDESIENIIGFNYRMTELQAAIARVQLSKLDALNRRRMTLVNYLRERLSEFSCLTPLTPYENTEATYYLFTMRYCAEAGKMPRATLAAALQAEGITVSEKYTEPLYMQPMYQRRMAFKHGYPWSAKENAESTVSYEKGICPVTELLSSAQMLTSEHVRFPHTESDMDDIVHAFSKVLDSVR